MTVKINDTEVSLPQGSTISQALDAAGIKPAGIAVALNGTVVPKADYSNRTLADGDTILIIKAFYGG